MVIYHFYNTDRYHLTLFRRVLICYETLLSIILFNSFYSEVKRIEKDIQ